MTSPWTTDDIPDLSGQTAVVTGANGGLGVETCKALAKAGAHVVMACRNLDKANEAMEAIYQDVPTAQLEQMMLDLSSQASVRTFSENFLKHHEHLHLLINNAGIIGMPLRRTEDGFELQMAVDCLGHFALTGLLMPALRSADSARVVAVGTSSQPHSFGRVDVHDLNWEKRPYEAIKATGQAKLAFQMWTFELNERLKDNGIHTVAALVAHPGIAKTNVSFAASDLRSSPLRKAIMHAFVNTTHQSAYMGALPTLYAATSSDATGGDYIGPNGLLELWGYPTHLQTRGRMRDRDLAGKLWKKAEELTGVYYLSDHPAA